MNMALAFALLEPTMVLLVVCLGGVITLGFARRVLV
jgi:hypothetical protein